MSEYWKSTPKYHCKYCDTYVRDTKLERTNHEATGKHQGAIKRFLRDLHRGAENEEREKERARREIERLNGIVPSAATVPGSSTADHAPPEPQRKGAYTQPDAPATLSAAERKAHMEQLAELGVAIPQQFRGDMAMAGEWSTTTERVIRRKVVAEDKGVQDDAGKNKRDLDEQEEEDDAVRGLFKKQKTGRWGRNSKKLDAKEEAGLDDLLGAIGNKKEVKKEDAEVKKEDEAKEDEVKKEEVKKEEGSDVPADKPDIVKPEPEDSKVALSDIPAEGDAAPARDGDAAPAVFFKKRKPKNTRQR